MTSEIIIIITIIMIIIIIINFLDKTCLVSDTENLKILIYMHVRLILLACCKSGVVKTTQINKGKFNSKQVKN